MGSTTDVCKSSRVLKCKGFFHDVGQVGAGVGCVNQSANMCSNW